MENGKLSSIRQMESEFEVLILAGMIFHTSFLKKIYKVAIPQNFSNRYIGAIAEGVLDYFDTTGKAPDKDIRTVFLRDFNRHVKTDEDQEIFDNVEMIIDNIMSRYYNKSFNADYVYRAGNEYLIEQDKKRSDEEAVKALELGNRIRAEEILKESKDRTLDNERSFISIIDPSQIQEACRVMTTVDMEFDGVVGKYLHPIRKPYFISMLAPTKRGKSNWLMEWVIQGSANGLNVAYFPLEMTANVMLTFMIQRITGRIITKEPQKIHHWIPVWDCLRNQLGTCAVTQQCDGSNRLIWSREYRAPQRFRYGSKHTPCDFCRHSNKQSFRDLYEPTTWFNAIEKPSFVNSIDRDEYVDLVHNFLPGEIKMQEHLVGTASWRDIYDALDFEERVNGWVPDMIVIDSLDSMTKDRKLGEYRHQIGNIWEQAARLAAQRNVILISATQGNRFSFLKDKLEIVDVAEDWSKAMIATAICAINARGETNKIETQSDLYWQRQQLEWLIHRYKKRSIGMQCTTINNLEFNSVALDSMITPYRDIVPGKKLFENMLQGDF